MGMLTREQMSGVNDRPIVEVEVPEWGGSVGMRSVTVSQRGEIESDLRAFSAKAPGALDVRRIHMKLVALSVCDAEGAPLFDSVERVNEHNPDVIARLFNAALEANGFHAAAVAAAEKNLDATQTESSFSGSPAISE